MPGIRPRIETLCTHRRALRREHLRQLAPLRVTLGRTDGPPTADPAPIVLVHCGDPGERRGAKDARLGCEVVRVRVDGPAALPHAAELVRGAARFAEEAGDLRGPRRAPLAALGRTPIEISEALCPGSARCGICIESCPARALHRGADGRPALHGGACTYCGDCVARCPLGAVGFAHAPWRALNARLEALLANAGARPVALLLRERGGPPPPDGPWETEQPRVPWLLPMALPRGALGAGVVLRALELGAAAVYALAAGDETWCAGGGAAAVALARAMGWGDRVVRVRSLDEVVARTREGPPPPRPRLDPVARDPSRRPDAGAIALSLWRREASRAPFHYDGPAAFGGAAALEEDACTLCGLCAAACPTGALALRPARAVALAFDPSRCPGPCGRCESACPARALTLSPQLRLPPQRTTLVERAGTCSACGADWPEAASVPALGPKLAAGENPALFAFLSACPGCRSRALGASLGPAGAAGPPRRPHST